MSLHESWYSLYTGHVLMSLLTNIIDNKHSSSEMLVILTFNMVSYPGRLETSSALLVEPLYLEIHVLPDFILKLFNSYGENGSNSEHA